MSKAVPSTKAIPIILLPYFYAIADATKQEAWLVQIYHDKIVPYVQSLAKKFIFDNDKLDIHNLLLLQAYLQQNKHDYTTSEKARLFNLQNSLKNPNTLVMEIENSFFSNILHQSDGFFMDSFLPLTLKKHLGMILKIQLLLYLDNILSSLNQSDNQDQLIIFHTWIKKELNNRLSNNKAAASFKKDNFTNVQPSWGYYFFSGAQHVFVFFQFEYLNLRNIINEGLALIGVFNKNGFNAIDILHLLTVGSIRFVLNLFLMSLAPYRFLRTSANQFSNIISTYLQDFLITQFPFVYKSTNWQALYFTFQLLLYAGLILSIGLPLIPIPLSSIPEIFVSMTAFYLPLIYSATILSGSLLSRFIEKITRSEATVLEKIDKRNTQMMSTLEKDTFTQLMFDRHCAQQQALFVHSNKVLNHLDLTKNTIKLR